MTSDNNQSSPNSVPKVTQGLILNDNDLEMDHLSRVVYAKALAQQIDSINTPITIGLLATWGSGKSFLLKQFQSILKSLQEDRKKKEKKTLCSTIIQICFAFIVLALSGLAIAAFVSEAITVYLGIALLFILLLFLIIWIYVSKSDSMYAKNRIGFFWVIIYALFTRLPIRKNQFSKISVTPEEKNKFIKELWEEKKKAKKNEKNRRFIFVDYNAWKYSRSDILWGAIVTTMAEKIEKEFGFVTTRMFQSLSLALVNEKDGSEDLKEESKKAHKKNSFINHVKNDPRPANIVVFLGAVLVFFLSIALLIYILITDQTRELIEGILVDKILVSLPAGITVLLVILKSLWTLRDSFETEVTKLLKRASKDVTIELGLMEKIRKQIQSMVDLVHTVELSYGFEYKVIITIDDLDRIPQSKVKAILEAVNILLSDRNSPFICVIAVDSRVVRNCLSADQKNKNVPSSVNGNEYLKKIINLPFCLHEMGTEATSSFLRALAKESTDPEKLITNVSSGSTESTSQPNTNGFKFQDFLEECRKVMYEKEDLKTLMVGNPRNVKRIFNIISMTVYVIDVMQTYKLQNPQQETDIHAHIKTLNAEELTCWIVLTEQWPFRMSYILAMIDIYDEKKEDDTEFDDNAPLIDIYRRFMSDDAETLPLRSFRNLLSLDYAEIVLENFLDSHQNLLTKGAAKRVRNFAINLDSSIKKQILTRRDGWCKLISKKMNQEDRQDDRERDGEDESK